jgi:hypothetical protein
MNVVGGMTMSLDGFVTDRDGSVERLYPDLDALRKTQMLQEQIRTTGAVVMGRHAYDMAEGDLTGYEFQVPIFVLTHHPPEQGPRGQKSGRRGPRGPRPPTPPDVRFNVSGGFLYGCNSTYLSERLTRP